MKTFDTYEEAMDWMIESLHTMDERCIDNYRFAYMDDKSSCIAYHEIENDGCCGSFDEEIVVNGRLAKIGCNYGH